MVKIRLKRVGAKKAPFYNVVVADSRTARNGKIIDEVGYYNPMTNPVEIKIDLEKVETWIKNGAKPTDTVRYLLEKSNVKWNTYSSVMGYFLTTKEYPLLKECPTP